MTARGEPSWVMRTGSPFSVVNAALGRFLVSSSIGHAERVRLSGAGVSGSRLRPRPPAAGCSACLARHRCCIHLTMGLIPFSHVSRAVPRHRLHAFCSALLTHCEAIDSFRGPIPNVTGTLGTRDNLLFIAV